MTEEIRTYKATPTPRLIALNGTQSCEAGLLYSLQLAWASPREHPATDTEKLDHSKQSLLSASIENNFGSNSFKKHTSAINIK